MSPVCSRTIGLDIRILVLTTTTFAVLLGIGLSVEHLLDNDHYNPGFDEFPLTITLHVVLGALYLGLAAFQLVPRFRERRPEVHRVIGRVGVGFGLVSAATAIAATVLFPFSGRSTIVFIAPFAVTSDVR